MTARGVLRPLGRRLPFIAGSIDVPGLCAPLRIARDRWGVPHIDAESCEDAWFGAGFCHAQDRAFQLEIMLRVGRGTLSQLVGGEGLRIDRLSRRLGLHRVAAAQLQAQDEDVRALLEAYARGVNAGLARGARRVPHELALLRAKPTPWTAADALSTPKVLGIGGLAENWALEHARLRIATLDGQDALRETDPSYPDWLEVIADLDALRRAAGAGGGSNNWAIAGARTRTGRPLLANDPHLPPTVPGIFYLLHLHTDEWDLVGASTPGCPGMTIGHNRHAAWGVTSGMADVADLCVEQVSADGASVREGERLVPCEVREERISVRGRRREVVERVTVTPRGPIVSPAGQDETPALSMRCALLDPQAKLTGPLRMQEVRSFEDLQGQAAGWPFPLNVLYADADGHIGWQLTGRIPLRPAAEGAAGSGPAGGAPGNEPGGGVARNEPGGGVAGNEPAGGVAGPGPGVLPRTPESPDWEGWLSSQQLPSAFDPQRGFLASANNKPLPDGEGPYLGCDWMDGYRAQAISEALAARGDWSLDDAGELQQERHSLPWRELRETVLGLREAVLRPWESVGALQPREPVLGGVGQPPPLAALRVQASRLRRGLDLLQAWDGEVSAESLSAGVFELMLAELARRIVAARAPHSVEWALGAGVNPIEEHTTLGLRRVSQIVSLLRQRPEGWFEHGWDVELADALAAAVGTLQERRGEDCSRWAWGSLRKLEFQHPLGTRRPLHRVFNLAPIPYGGDTNTIPQAAVDPLDPTGNPLFVAGLRAVFDVGDWDRARFVLATGQSGNPLSPHYEDQHQLWREGASIEIPVSPGAVGESTVAALQLRPCLV